MRADFRPSASQIQHSLAFTVNPAPAPYVAANLALAGSAGLPSFSEFAQTWLLEKSVEWRASYTQVMRSTLARHLLPVFGGITVNQVSRAAVLQARVQLAQHATSANDPLSHLSPDTVNRVMRLLGMILREAEIRFGIPNPARSIRSLKLPRQHSEPFTLEETQRLVGAVRVDYRNYLTVRVYSGLRPGELHALTWADIDFAENVIRVRRSISGYTKTDSSQRDVYMVEPIHRALLSQRASTTDPAGLVFAGANGAPIDNKNFVRRIWRPLLQLLGLPQRRPYQLRHTCASLCLSAGENPQWVAHQLGHSSVRTLFRVYARYVPNMTRRDGSAFNRTWTQSQRRSKKESP